MPCSDPNRQKPGWSAVDSAEDGAKALKAMVYGCRECMLDEVKREAALKQLGTDEESKTRFLALLENIMVAPRTLVRAVSVASSDPVIDGKTIGSDNENSWGCIDSDDDDKDDEWGALTDSGDEHADKSLTPKHRKGEKRLHADKSETPKHRISTKRPSVPKEPAPEAPTGHEEAARR